jgi:hypothetical protein
MTFAILLYSHTSFIKRPGPEIFSIKALYFGCRKQPQKSPVIPHDTFHLAAVH